MARSIPHEVTLECSLDKRQAMSLYRALLIASQNWPGDDGSTALADVYDVTEQVREIVNILLGDPIDAD